MLTEKQVAHIKDALDTCKRPFFFFHDDPDGFASFLILRRYVGDGKGHVVKATPAVTEALARKVHEYGPDVVFVLDLAYVDQDFIDAIDVPIIWIDHHSLQEREGVYYANPRQHADDNIPASALCYQITQTDLWLAIVGSIGDWYFPPYVVDFRTTFPDLFPETLTRAEDVYFDSPLSPVVKAFSFNLKGSTGDVVKSIKTMMKIDSPYEILRQETSRGRLIWRRYEKINHEYEVRLAAIVSRVQEQDPILLYTYTDDKLSLTKDLANELIHRYPKKVIVLGRRKNGFVKCSIRSTAIDLPPLLERVLQDVQGTGGGHEHACGANILEEDFDRFVSALRALV